MRSRSTPDKKERREEEQVVKGTTVLLSVREFVPTLVYDDLESELERENSHAPRSRC